MDTSSIANYSDPTSKGNSFHDAVAMLLRAAGGAPLLSPDEVRGLTHRGLQRQAKCEFTAPPQNGF